MIDGSWMVRKVIVPEYISMLSLYLFSALMQNAEFTFTLLLSVSVSSFSWDSTCLSLKTRKFSWAMQAHLGLGFVFKATMAMETPAQRQREYLHI